MIIVIYSLLALLTLSLILLLVKLDLLQKKIEVLIADNARHESKSTSISEYAAKLENEKNQIAFQHQQACEALNQAQKSLELKKQEMEDFKKRVGDWENSRHEAITQAKAAIFETATQLSEHLIAKHKSETQESEEKLTSNTKKLQDQFEKIIENVAVLNSDIKSSRESVDQVKNALLSPAGAGSLAEITLENILKASGLLHERDFFMQYSFAVNQDGKRLRPDAIIFLPANNLMIIDSKASKYFTEVAQSKTSESEAEISNKLKSTMRKHLSELADKSYHEYLREHLKDRKINHISSIMFLPSEVAVEKLSQIDKEFIQMAWQKDIFPVGPSGLINTLAYAKFQVSITKQEENQLLIIEEVKRLLSSLGVLCEYAKKVGSSLYNASNHFDKFAGSLNANLLPKARNLAKLGVQLPQNKSLPRPIERFTILNQDKSQLIEVENAQHQEEL